MGLLKRHKTNLGKTKFTVDFIGIGAARSGTSWIAQCLSEHPQIFIPKVKELEFFNREINVFKKNHIFNDAKKCFSKYDKEGVRGYMKHFLEAGEDQIKGEWSVKYLHEPEVAEKIKKEFPNVKILVCLRNPIDRAYSQFYFAKYKQGFERCCQSFEEGFEKHPNFYYYNSLYYEQLKRYFDLFPLTNILVLIYEDIQKNPLKFIQKIYHFLGVDDTFVPPSLNRKVNPTVKYSYPFLVTMYSLVAKMLTKMGMKKVMDILKKTWIKKVSDFIVTEEVVNRPLMRVETRKRFQRIFADDIRDLEKLIKRDLSFWE